MRRTLLAIPILLALILVACTQSQITQSVTTALSIIQASIPFLSAAQTDPQAIADLEKARKYAADANVAIGRVVDILDAREAGGLNTAVAFAESVSVLSGIAKPNLNPGTPQQIIGLVQNISGAVADLLRNFKAPPSTRAKGPTVNAQRFELTYKDRRVLAKARAAVKANDAKLVAIEVRR